MKPLIFATYCTNDEWYYNCAIPLKNSFKYFHPTILFKIITPQETNDIFQRYNVDISYGKPYLASSLYNEYEQVVLMDADQIICDTLDVILHQTCQIAAPRIMNDHGTVQCWNPEGYNIPGIVLKDQYLSAGLVSIRGKNVWEKWQRLNQTKNYDLEQGTLNLLAYDSGFNAEQLDPLESIDYYGPTNSWGPDSDWQSWKDIELIENKLWLPNTKGLYKKIKILHRANAGKIGSSKDKFPKELFKPEVYEYLLQVRA